MARIRSVRPELRTSLTVLAWPREVRYFWVLLWGYLDDHGYGVDEPRLIKPDCFPMDDDLSPDDIDKWLTLIASSGALCRYRGPDGRRYLHAPKWAEYQRPQHPSVPKFPFCVSSHETVMNISGDSHETVMSANGVNPVPAGQAPSGDSHEDSGGSHETLTPYVVGVAVPVEVAKPARATRSRPEATLLGNSLLDEHRRLVKPSMPRDVAQAVGQRIDSLLDDPEVTPDEIREGLRRLRSNRKWGPGMLANLVHEYRQELAGQADPRRRSQQETDDLFARSMQREMGRGPAQGELR